MPDLDLDGAALDGLLAGAVTGVLETMFFAEAISAGAPEGLPALAAALSFRGRPSGEMTVCVSTAALRPLAAGFLGEDEANITETQAAEVICEIANMLCGSVVSQLESEKSFDLASPRLIPAHHSGLESQTGHQTTSQTFAIQSGTLTVALRMEREDSA